MKWKDPAEVWMATFGDISGKRTEEETSQPVVLFARLLTNFSLYPVVVAFLYQVLNQVPYSSWRTEDKPFYRNPPSGSDWDCGHEGLMAR